MRLPPQKNLNISITLIAFFSKKEDFCFYDELVNIGKNNSNIKIIYVMKKIKSPLIKKHIKNISKHLYYIVGSPGSVLDLEEAVSGMGIPSERIFIEDFEGY